MTLIKKLTSFRIVLLLITCLTLMTNFVHAQVDTLWHEDWEGDWTVNWHASAGTWEVGIPTSGPDSTYSPVNCAATVLNGNYSEPVDSRLIRHASFVVPPASENPRLRFWHWFSFSAYDFGSVEISTDNGISWEEISVHYYSTGSGVWSYPSIDLSAYEGQLVLISFYFHSHSLGGVNVSTGWYIDDVALLLGEYVFNNPEGFENGIGDWAVERGTWEVGLPVSGPGSAYNGQKCAATNLKGNYAEPVDSRLISPPFRVPLVNPALRFWHWYNFSAYDYGIVEIKMENGSWQPVSQQFLNTSSGVWTFYHVSLSEYADSLAQLAFNFHSHSLSGINVSSGWYVDEIEILGDPNSIEDYSQEIAFSQFELHQNYPNPFNPSTTIGFTLPQAALVKLTIFNTLGQEVAELLNEDKHAGSHEVVFDSFGLNSGVYYYRVEAGEYRKVRKMLILK